MSKMFDPSHPGEILREFIPEDMTVTEDSSRLGISRVALSRILNGKSGISSEMAIRIALLTGTTPESWLDNQMKRDLWKAESRRDRGLLLYRKSPEERSGKVREQSNHCLLCQTCSDPFRKRSGRLEMKTTVDIESLAHYGI